MSRRRATRGSNGRPGPWLVKSPVRLGQWHPPPAPAGLADPQPTTGSDDVGPSRAGGDLGRDGRALRAGNTGRLAPFAIALAAPHRSGGIEQPERAVDR